MGTALAVAGVFAAFVALRSSVLVGTGVLLGTTFLVPGNLQFHGFPIWMPFGRLVLWAFATGLVIKVRKGEIALDVLRPRRLHFAAAAFVAVAFVNGVALVPVTNNLVDAGLLWLSFFDQLVFLVCVVAACRVIGVWTVAIYAAVFAAGTGVIAAVEHYTHITYATWWYDAVGISDRVLSADLVSRGGVRRVRGPFQFALEYAWVAVMLLPIAVVVASRSRRWIAPAGAAMLTLGVVWTVSRSASAGIAVALVVLVVASRFDRRTSGAVLLAGLVAGIVLLANPALDNPFHEAERDSVASRYRRLAVVTRDVERDPYVGLGLAGPADRGVYGTDSSYSLVYASLGVPGVVVFGVMIVTALASAASGVTHPDRHRRVVAAAALAGLAAAAVGDAAMNIFFVPGSSKTYWLLAALGVAAGERSLRPRLARPVSRWRVALPVAGVAVGITIAFVIPRHDAVTERFQTFSIAELAQYEGDTSFVGRTRIDFVCETVAANRAPGVKVECADPRIGSGIGELRIESRDAAAVSAMQRRIDAAMRPRMPGYHAVLVERGSGTPTWAHTAPFSGGVLGLAAALLVPPLPARRRRRADALMPLLARRARLSTT
jgi:hypothetical protein